jgi:hypothetical protein
VTKQDEVLHYCRGCGRVLQIGFKGHFHPECLRIDKQRRTRARRAQERKRFAKWQRDAVCPHCGLTYGSFDSGQSKEYLGEPSQGRQEREKAAGRPEEPSGQKEATDAADCSNPRIGHAENTTLDGKERHLGAHRGPFTLGQVGSHEAVTVTISVTKLIDGLQPSHNKRTDGCRSLPDILRSAVNTF